MSLRKEVFQTKVLQKLYPAALKVEKALETPIHHRHTDKSCKAVQLKPIRETGNAGVPVISGRKVYTVLPPPKSHFPASGSGSGLPTHTQLANNADEKPEPESCNASEDDTHTNKKMKRRRKRKVAPVAEGTPKHTSANDDKSDGTEERNKGNGGSSESLSKNKKRKMKKKRHKEKLMALGLVPRSMALEFTYQQSKEQKEEDEEKKVDEILDFLRSTRDLYLSDRSHSTHDPAIFLNAAESLFTHLSDLTSPPALSILCQLSTLLRQREEEKLLGVLRDFTHASTLPKDETDVICTLFNYWMTEVLPLQMEKPT